MKKDLNIYKRNRINELYAIFNSTLKRLNSILAIDIRNIQISKLQNRQAIINALIYKYNRDVSLLRNNLNLSIQKINSFIPDFLVNKANIQNKKALLIGINYINTPYALNGCIDDTNKMKDFLSKYGFNDFNIITDLTQCKPTKDNILNELKNLLINSNSNDLLFFYFSGHGSYTYDVNNDEVDKKDEMIISSDLKELIDDEIKNNLIKYLKKDVTLIGLFDSCHSGTILDLKYNYLDSNNYNNYSENNKVTTECEGNVIMISGCMDNQTSMEAIIDNKPQGVLTKYFIQSLTNNSNCSWRELLKSMREAIKKNGFSQIPQLSTDSIYDINSKVFI
jgi:hypothetical protein